MHTHEKNSKSISVIGLGAMGSGIARAYLSRGWSVSVWNRSRAKVDALVSDGAHACDTPTQAVLANVHTVVCVSDYAVWRAILNDHQLGEQFKDRCLIQLTTGTIEDVEAHAAIVESYGGRLVEGAIMCFPSNLGTDDASLLLAGDEEVLKECGTLLQVLDGNWTNLGENIHGPAVLSRALMAGMTAALMGVVNGAAMCRAGGVSLDTYLKFYSRNDGLIRSEQNRLVHAIRDGNTEENEASLKAWREGNVALLSVAGSLGTDLTLQRALQAMFQKGKDRGLDGHDLSALVDVFDPKDSIRTP